MPTPPRRRTQRFGIRRRAAASSSVVQQEAVLRPVRPNIGIEVALRRRLQCIIDEMHTSVMHWVKAQWRKNPPVLAADALPARELERTIKDLTERWEGRFAKAAPELAAYFSTAIGKRSDATLRSILRKGGFSVKFKITRAQRDAMEATIGEQVGLIKSIPARYLSQVETMVMQSVTTGRDLGTLAKGIEKQFGVTKRRAALIARDQNNKATATLNRVRLTELGIEYAIWQHSGGGRDKRPTHVKNSGKRYKISEGWFDPAENRYIHPGELINCKCVSGAIVKGFS